MKNRIFSLLALLAVMLFVACQDYEPIVLDKPEMSPVAVLVETTLTGTVELAPSQADATRATAYDDEDAEGMEYIFNGWRDGDQVGVFGEGIQNACFTYSAKDFLFHGSIPEGSTMAFVYYPYNPDATNANEIPVTLADTELKDYAHFIHTYEVYGGSVQQVWNPFLLRDEEHFVMYRPTTLMRMFVDLEGVEEFQDEALESLALTASTPLTGDFTLDATLFEPVITATDDVTNTITLVLDPAQPTDERFITFAVMAPTPKKDDPLTLTLATANKWARVETAALSNFVAGNRFANVAIIDAITFTREGNTAQIFNRVKEFTLSTEAVELYPDSTASIAVTVMPEDATPMSGPTFTSSNDEVVTVDENGTVKAVAPGEAEIVVTIDGMSQTVAVTVIDPIPEDAFFIEATGDEGTKVSLEYTSSSTLAMEYVIGEAAWQSYTSKTQLSLKKGERVYFRNTTMDNTKFTEPKGVLSQFSITGDGAKVGGNIMYLINKDGKGDELDERAFAETFSHCPGLTDASELVLPDITMGKSCFENMFYGCTNLTTAPALPAKTLAESCYLEMFKSCTSLTTAPALSAETLAESCCERMFFGCTSLTTAPDLPAETLAMRCYQCMFIGCSKLNYIKVDATDISATASTTEWVGLVAPTGDFICPENMETVWTTGENGIPEGWRINGKSLFPEDAFFIEATGSEGTKVSLQYTSSSTLAMEYVIGEAAWQSYTSKTELSLKKGDIVRFRNTTTSNTKFNDPKGGLSQFSITGDGAKVGGNIMYLINKDGKGDKLDEKAFAETFYNCTGLTDASELVLPDITMGKYCLYKMFFNCSSLTTAPVLNAKTLAESCYQDMFNGCSNLTTAPALPAETLAEDCYNYMFGNCTSLTTASALPAKTLDERCYQFMFIGCTSLTTAPALPAKTLAESCYQEMFSGCTSLEKAPDLPAETLAGSCYWLMFDGCSKLNYIKVDATDISAESCTDGWVKDVAPTGDFICPENMETVWAHGFSGIPRGWRTNPKPKDAFFIEATGSEGTKVSLQYVSSSTLAMEYAIGEAAWQPYTSKTELSLKKGERVYFRNTTMDNTKFTDSEGDLSQFSITGDGAKVGGNIMYLINKDGKGDEVGKFGLCHLFEKCTDLSDASELLLPATTVGDYAYANMFAECCNVVGFPAILPATTLGKYCYQYMFHGCLGMKESPELPAQVLVEGCYMNMFSGCGQLELITVSATDNTAQNCTKNWVFGVADAGHLITPAQTSWVAGADGIPNNWTRS